MVVSSAVIDGACGSLACSRIEPSLGDGRRVSLVLPCQNVADGDLGGLITIVPKNSKFWRIVKS
jgi:hypothetical protein